MKKGCHSQPVRTIPDLQLDPVFFVSSASASSRLRLGLLFAGVSLLFDASINKRAPNN